MMRRQQRSSNKSPADNRRRTKNRPYDMKKAVQILIGSLVMLGFLYYFETRDIHHDSDKCAVSLGSFGGTVYNQKDTLSTKCLVESKFLKVQQHKVRFGDQIIDDWLWIDYHDRINVLVENEDNKYLVFAQTKYALEERSSLAIIGGIIEPKESAQDAASREVEEETGLHCRDFHFLGRYRTDVNRGMGWVNSFLASNCKESKTTPEESKIAEEEVGVADMEQQTRRLLTLDELRYAAMDGKFLEVQWSNTVALALLHKASAATAQEQK